MTTLEKLEELVYHGFGRSHQNLVMPDPMVRRSGQEADLMVKKGKEAEENPGEPLASLIKKLGLFTEFMVLPSVMDLFCQRSIELSDVASRMKAWRRGDAMEVDVVAAGPEIVIAIEAQSRMDLSGVEDFLERLPHFFEFFPRYSGLKLYGAVAGMSVDSNVPRFAYNQGLFVLAPCGENLQILNDKEFVPREFGKSD